MKRTQRRLALNPETIRALTTKQIEIVAGGITSYELCASKPVQDCVSWTCGGIR